MRFIKNFFKWFAIIVVALIVLAYATGNSHLLKGVANTYLKGRMGPSINESQIFANRVVKAGNYQPWPKALDYNKKQIPTSPPPSRARTTVPVPTRTGGMDMTRHAPGLRDRLRECRR